MSTSKAVEDRPDAKPAKRTPPDELRVSALPGIGAAREGHFERLGVRSVRDLLFLLPRRLESAARTCAIAEARQLRGEHVTIRGQVERVSLQRFGRRSTLRATITDGSGSIAAVFFNQPYLRKRFALGDELELSGRIVDAQGPALAAPKIGTREKPLATADGVLTVYPQTDGLGQSVIASACRRAAREHAHALAEPLSEGVLAKLALPCLSQAVAHAHQPRSAAEFAAARRRIALEHLLCLQARLFERSRARERGRALAIVLDARTHAQLLERFAFELTAGQRAVAAELRADLARPIPMRRLLQGDVGCGKTVLGLYACMSVASAGGQSAFLAPTEILAEQHFDGLRPLLERAGLRAVLLTGSLGAAERAQVLGQLESGMADIAFGTHALFGSGVRYRRLALVVIDEQQRFGVSQRARLLEKGSDVHALLMTATPIPRTLALTLYGDLDTSTLSDRPPGRGSVRTRWLRGPDRKRLGGFLRERLAADEQIYWVVPRIGDGDGEQEETGASAEKVFERLQRSSFAQWGIELVHGRVPSLERTQRIERFRRGDVRILVATSVIEVGVDVAAATVIVIDNAERLGLAQLHQLRGRVGRGARDAWCLIAGSRSAAERFEFFERTQDGFLIAEEDLRRRGMGDLAGLRQAGSNTEGLSDLAADLDLLFAARDLIARDPAVFEAYRDRAGDPVVP